MATKHPDRAATVPVLIRLTPAMLAMIKETEQVIGLDVTGYVRRAVWDSLKADGFVGPGPLALSGRTSETVEEK